MSIRIAIAGDENLALTSHRELNAARLLFGNDVSSRWVHTGSQEMDDLSDDNGVWLAPGSPYNDDEAVLRVIEWARTSNIPFLGTCGGLQYGVMEFFRNVLLQSTASHAESDGEDQSNVIHPLTCSLYGEEREIIPIRGTRFSSLVSNNPFTGMHYCRYAPRAQEIESLTKAGMQLEAIADDAAAEVLELPENAFYFLTLFQPQIGSIAGMPLHPLVEEFLRCARRHHDSHSDRRMFN